jgi:small subunit ribosomal protein S9
MTNEDNTPAPSEQPANASTPETTPETPAPAPAPEAVEPVAVPAVPEAPAAEAAPVMPSEKLEPAAAPVVTKPATAGGWFWGTGRRKASVARVRIRPGDGMFCVNKKPMTTFFNEERDHKDLNRVLELTRTTGQLEIQVNVHGGGYTGQAGAILLGLGRALRNYDSSLEPILREHGILSRDPRRVERKKPGQPGARRKFQFSKR